MAGAGLPGVAFEGNAEISENDFDH
jgi:hypothetical protein